MCVELRELYSNGTIRISMYQLMEKLTGWKAIIVFHPVLLLFIANQLSCPDSNTCQHTLIHKITDTKTVDDNSACFKFMNKFIKVCHIYRAYSHDVPRNICPSHIHQ